MNIRIIKKHLEKFKDLSEKDQYKEFLFCLLTPQSNAQRCWQAVKELSQCKSFTQQNVVAILKTKTRFHNTKAQRIIQAQKTFKHIQPSLNAKNIIALRHYLAHVVNGYGLKEAGHFLRNIGKSNNQIAILDRHILKHLVAHNLLKEPKIKSPKHYPEIEQLFLAHARRLHIEPDVLDLYWWGKENGELFK